MTSRAWDDLAPRLISGAVIAAFGLAALWAGGVWVKGLAVLSAGVMTWELARMGVPGRPLQAVVMGAFAAAMLTLALWKHDPYWMHFLAAPPLLTALRATRDRIMAGTAAAVILAAAYGIVALREGLGWPFVLWLVALVAAVDTLGYFGGRMIGGPKFWPRVSPKKTWSGTVSGWAGAAAVGAGAVALAGAPAWVVWFSALVGLASQLGDIGESVVKRRAGIKDASAILPGHGGLMDRFDGMAGAVVFLLLWAQVAALPVIGGQG
jgi:phosphatidate cytidylyltransferase